MSVESMPHIMEGAGPFSIKPFGSPLRSTISARSVLQDQDEELTEAREAYNSIVGAMITRESS